MKPCERAGEGWCVKRRRVVGRGGRYTRRTKTTVVLRASVEHSCRLMLMEGGGVREGVVFINRELSRVRSQDIRGAAAECDVYVTPRANAH